MRKKGLGLPAVLLVTSFLVLLGFTLVSMATGRMRANTQMDTLMQADCLAESAANLALAKIMQDPQFGLNGSPDDRSVKMSVAGTQGVGRATFDSGRASQWGLPCSTNNLSGWSAVSGYQRSIPAQTVQIIAEGRVGATVRRLEAVVSKPPFKYALASSGTIYSGGGLLVQGVKDLSALSQGVQNIPADLITPGYVACNTGDDHGLQLLSSAALPTLVTGDAQSCGGVVLGPATTVKGAVKDKSDPIKLPQLHVTDYDPQGMQSTTELPQGTYSSKLWATGIMRRSGDLMVQQGLNLDNAYLYVDGNLQVQGGLTGHGAVFATGSLNIQGNSSFSADGMEAFVAKGSITVSGSAKDTSFFNGLLYTEGNFAASDITLVGTVIANSPVGSQMAVTRANVMQNPTVFSFDFQFPGLKPKQIPSLSIDAAGGGVHYYADVIRDPQLDYSKFFDPATNAFRPDWVNSQSSGIQFVLQRTPDGKVWKLSSPQEIADTLTSEGLPVANLSQMTNDLKTNQQERVDELKKQIQDVDALYQKTHLDSLKQGKLCLDPNQFLQVGDQLRKVLWRHIP